MEKHLALRRLSEDQKADPYAINKVEWELNILEQGFSGKAHRTEAEQRRVLTPEQRDKTKDMGYGYGSPGYNRRGYGRH